MTVAKKKTSGINSREFEICILTLLYIDAILWI